MKDHDIDLESGSEPELPPEEVSEPVVEKSETQKTQGNDAEALRKVRQSLGMSESQPDADQMEKQEAIPKPETTETKEKSAEVPGRIEKYKQPDSSINYRKIIDDLGTGNFTDNVQEKKDLADEALAQLQTEAEATRKQIEAEKNREQELRQSGKWDSGQKSGLRELSARDDVLYGYEQSVKRLKRDLERSVPNGRDERSTSDISMVEKAKNENGGQNFVEINDNELREEVGNSLREVVQDIDGLEGSLRASGSFITPKFEADVLRTAIGESGIDFRKISAAFEDMTKKFKRDFTTEIGGKRPMIESGHYRRAIGALESLENNLTKFRSKIEHRKTETANENFKNLEKEISTTISAARRNREFLNELRQMSQRFEDGR